MGQMNFRNGSPQGFYAKNLQNVAVKLQMYSAALKNPMPALSQIEELFIAMEEERFLNYGAAPMFGIPQQWESLADSTVLSKQGYGGDRPLVNFGYLHQAAVTPIIVNTPKSAVVTIDPRKTGAPQNYSRGKDYGYFHQTGDNESGIAREIITITPAFKEEAMRIMQSYIGVGKQKVAKIAKANAARIESSKSTYVEQALRRDSQAVSIKSRISRTGNKELSASGKRTVDRNAAELARMKDPSLSTYSHYENIRLTRQVQSEFNKANKLNSSQVDSLINRVSGGKLNREKMSFYNSTLRENQVTGAQRIADGFGKP
jgi:hypothetical protein